MAPSGASKLAVDLWTVIARIEQAYTDPAMRECLLERLYSCDVPRLRSHLLRTCGLCGARLGEYEPHSFSEHLVGREE